MYINTLYFHNSLHWRNKAVLHCTHLQDACCFLLVFSQLLPWHLGLLACSLQLRWQVDIIRCNIQRRWEHQLYISISQKQQNAEPTTISSKQAEANLKKPFSFSRLRCIWAASCVIFCFSESNLFWLSVASSWKTQHYKLQFSPTIAHCGDVLACLSVSSEVQMIFIWSSWCHCRFTHAVLEKNH